jgi:negative regulator of flagellin synthesis FlgM
MRVSHTGSNPAQGTEVSSTRKGGHVESLRSKGGESAAAAGRTEENADAKADISARGREFARVKEAATKAPDVREEKIAELKRRIAAGKYHVDADAVADRMVDEHIKMSGIG